MYQCLCTKMYKACHFIVGTKLCLGESCNVTWLSDGTAQFAAGTLIVAESRCPGFNEVCLLVLLFCVLTPQSFPAALESVHNQSLNSIDTRYVFRILQKFQLIWKFWILQLFFFLDRSLNKAQEGQTEHTTCDQRLRNWVEIWAATQYRYESRQFKSNKLRQNVSILWGNITESIMYPAYYLQCSGQNQIIQQSGKCDIMPKNKQSTNCNC